jgi:hypothetical protein
MTLIKNNKDDKIFQLKDSISSIEVSLNQNEHKLYFFRPD